MSTPRNEDWEDLLEELEERRAAAAAMGGPARLERQAARGRLNVRERIGRLCDRGTFSEFGALAGAANPAGGESVPADGLVTGVAALDDRPVALLAEDFTVKGGSIGHVNAAKRLRLVELAGQERIPLLLLLDGAGERASNAFERYPFAPTDLQALADLRGRVPVVSLILGTSAGHGALSGLFADLIIMTEGSALFAAGPPLVQSALGLQVTPAELGGAHIHTVESGVAHNLAADEDDAFRMARRFLAYLPQHSGGSTPAAPTGPETQERRLAEILATIPADRQHPYDMRGVLDQLADTGSVFEVQPLYGQSIITCFARLGGHAVFIVANQPTVQAGAITSEAAEKAAHFLDVAGSFELPVVFLADNPGVMPGPEAERAGTLRAAARMYAAQRAIRSPKLHVTIRKAFGFGSSLMAMNPFDRQTLTLAFPGISLGGIPAAGGATASHASDQERRRMDALQSGAWMAADNGSYDRVIDPRDLRDELIRALRIRTLDTGAAR